jgi:hypothetical protein
MPRRPKPRPGSAISAIAASTITTYATIAASTIATYATIAAFSTNAINLDTEGILQLLLRSWGNRNRPQCEAYC